MASAAQRLNTEITVKKSRGIQHGEHALEHHGFMTHYTQLSVVHTISGMSLDGFALCGFETIEDMRERFYSRPEGPEVIAADVKNFADLKNSPNRLIVSEQRFY